MTFHIHNKITTIHIDATIVEEFLGLVVGKFLDIGDS